jgi:stalled ribosome rescue protein Dom34
MTHYHGCVWIDHREAKIFGIALEAADEKVVHDHHAPHHIHRHADHIGQGKAPPDHKFFAEVAEALKPYKALLIVGPGTARTEFAGYLTEKHPQIAKRIWAIEPMDHPTEPQLVASARKHFKAEDRMHPSTAGVPTGSA